MKKNWVLTRESFDALLAWLDSDREAAGQEYEEVRRRLIKLFTCRACGEPEDLTDETINRVIKKLPEIQNGFAGDKIRYFYGVANKVHLEYLRRKPVTDRAVDLSTPEDHEPDPEMECLDQCMAKLTSDNQTLLLEYYQEDKRAKINHRKHLAERLGIAANALRIRAYRIRGGVEVCVRECLNRQQPEIV